MISTITQATQNIFSRLNWKIYPSTLFSILTCLSIVPCVIFLPEKFAWENYFIENFQLLILFICFCITIKSKTNKKLFYWLSMIIFILILREINCGRSFFPVPNLNNSFLKWKEIIPNYYWLPTFLYISFMLYSIYYFLKNKLWKITIEYIKKAKIDFWNLFFLIFSMILGTLAENNLKNQMLEETTETLFYVSLTILIWLYSNNKNFKIEK